MLRTVYGEEPTYLPASIVRVWDRPFLRERSNPPQDLATKRLLAPIISSPGTTLLLAGT